MVRRGDEVAQSHRVKASIHTLAGAWPGSPAVDDDLVDACQFLGFPDPFLLVAAANSLGTVIGVLTLVVVALSGAISLLPLALLVAAVPPLIARHGTKGAARLKRTRGLGTAPALFGRLTLRLRVEPSLERASRFAARSGEGRLASALGEHVRQAQRRPEAGLRSFAAEWADWAPAVERASALVADAAEGAPERRERGYDRALETVLTGAERRLASFAEELRGPLTGLYAFGVLLPLALVGVLPAARLAGLTVGIQVLVLLYDVVIPLGLLVAGSWLLTRRPVAFPPPQVDATHPNVPDKRVEATLLGFGTGVATAAICAFVLPWALHIAAFGVGVGVGVARYFEPRNDVRERVRAVESGLPDALSLVGRRVADGMAVEQALAEVGSELPGVTGELLTEAGERGKRLGLPVQAAFFGRHGVLADVPSNRARDTGTMLSLAATEGAPAGDVLVVAGDHLRALHQVEADARQELAAVTGTLANTAVLFGPLVGGVTVSMVSGIPTGAKATPSGAVGTGAATFGTAALGQTVGVYVLALAVLLTALSTALEHGIDRSLIGYRVGIALPMATGAYIAAVVAAGAAL